MCWGLDLSWSPLCVVDHMCTWFCLVPDLLECSYCIMLESFCTYHLVGGGGGRVSTCFPQRKSVSFVSFLPS